MDESKLSEARACTLAFAVFLRGRDWCRGAIEVLPEKEDLARLEEPVGRSSARKHFSTKTPDPATFDELFLQSEVGGGWV